MRSATRAWQTRLWGLGLVALLLAPAVARTDGGPLHWRIDRAELRYTVTHKLHRVVGTSKQVEGSAVLLGDVLKVMARSPVASFDSGNSNRDAHVLEILAAAQFPQVTLRAVLDAAPSLAVGSSAEVTLRGEVELHGLRASLPVRAKLERLAEDRVRVALHCSDSLTAHKIERPRLLFVPLDDAIEIEATAEMSRMP